ncbi:hypothetical protein [Aureispira anguillae]|uniref:Uncharacterized protein n=1 Tax=Aureispira anguillae TaxID=2864201 RepID=A0A915YE58_9BACT|nr:hypothetical protein [Aureispira anguillae]BDS11462.1 hypothetical protein AsAng_0021760 [Aureispira anguillae]
MKKSLLIAFFSLLFIIPLFAAEATITLSGGRKIVVNDPNRDCPEMRRMLDKKYGGKWELDDWDCDKDGIHYPNGGIDPNPGSDIILQIELLEGEDPIQIEAELAELIHFLTNSGENVQVQFIVVHH